jgi:hypothetical protein
MIYLHTKFHEHSSTLHLNPVPYFVYKCHIYNCGQINEKGRYSALMPEGKLQISVFLTATYGKT